MTKTFTAYVQRSNGWWVAQLIEDTGVLVQARHLDQIKSAIRDALTLFPELTSSPEEAEVRIVLTEDTKH